jgi:hypothetical protein
LAIQTLDMAASATAITAAKCAYDYLMRLQAYDLRPSKRGKGNGYDNALVEACPMISQIIVAAFFKTTKAELIWKKSWPTPRRPRMQSSATSTDPTTPQGATHIKAASARSHSSPKYHKARNS